MESFHIAHDVARVLNSTQKDRPGKVQLHVFDEAVTGREDRASINKESLSPAQLEVVALEVALNAAALIRRRRAELADEHGHVGVLGTKTSEVDPVTEVDQASERLIREQQAVSYTHLRAHET